MGIININNIAKPVAVGLNWHLLTGTTSDRKEIDSLAAKNGTKIGFVATNEESGVTVLGLATGQRAGVSCGAGWLAKASSGESIVLVEPLDNDKLWLCAVRAGLPVQGLDTIIDLSELHQKLPEFLRDGQNPRICSTLENLENFGYENVSPQSFAELTANIKQEGLIQITGVSSGVMRLITVAVILIAVWFGVTTYLDKLEEDKRASEHAIRSQKQQQSDLAATRQAAAAHRQEAEAILRKVVLEQPAVGNFISAMLSSIEMVPLSVAGWSLSSFDCSPSSCSLTWTRSKVGTVLGFMGEAQSRGWELIKAEGNFAITVYKFTTEARSPSIDGLINDAVFRAAFETKLQELQLAGLNYKFASSKSIESMISKKVIPGSKVATQTPITPILPWKVGDAVITGNNIFTLRDTPDYLEHPNVAIKHVMADLKSNTWTMEVNYATR